MARLVFRYPFLVSIILYQLFSIGYPVQWYEVKKQSLELFSKITTMPETLFNKVTYSKTEQLFYRTPLNSDFLN